MKRHFGFLCCLAGFACLILSGVLTITQGIGVNARLYADLQMRANVLEDAEISFSELLRLDEALADCLKGSAAWDLDADGEKLCAGSWKPAFNARERAHMQDCQTLFDRLRTALRHALCFGAAFGLCGVALDRTRIVLAAWLAPLPIVLPLGALGIWAIADFSAAFSFFHKILFTNDLWLLNPATDLLIRLCPESLFVAMGARIGVFSLAWMLFVPTCTSVLAAKRRGQHGIRSANARKGRRTAQKGRSRHLIGRKLLR